MLKTAKSLLEYDPIPSRPFSPRNYEGLVVDDARDDSELGLSVISVGVEILYYFRDFHLHVVHTSRMRTNLGCCESVV